MYAFSENFVLPLSHDEVVYGKGSLLAKMPGDRWQKFANLRLLFGYMYAQPGKKLLFMGGEFGQWNEWNHESMLDWGALGIRRPSRPAAMDRRPQPALPREPALHKFDCSPRGFQWLDCRDSRPERADFLAEGRPRDPDILVACNFTPVPRMNYRVGGPPADFWDEVLNSDAVHLRRERLGEPGRRRAVAPSPPTASRPR